VETKFCQNCGEKNQIGAKFCQACGRKFNEELETDAMDVPVKPQEVTTADETGIIWEGKPSGICAVAKGPLNATRYILTNMRLTIKTGLIGHKEDQIELIRIKDIEVTQSLKDRALNIGKIKIVSTDNNDPILVLEEIQDPLKVRDLIWASVRAERTAHVRYISNA